MQKIGLGTAAIGRPEYINLRKNPQRFKDLKDFKSQGLQVLETAYNQGIRYFDTAPGYGMAEDLILEWLRKTNYKDVEIATKWGYKYMAAFKPKASVHEIKEHTLQLLNEQWKTSRKLMPNLSTLQIHSATFETGVLENLDILEQLHEIKTTHDLKIGLTSSGTNQNQVLKFALDIQVKGSPLFDVFQVTYNILEQSLISIQKNLIGKRLIIKEALANGRLLPYAEYPNYKSLYKVIEDLAIKYNTSSDAIALRFCIDSIKPFKVLSGASNPQQLTQNLAVDTFELSEDDLQLLKKFKVDSEAYWTERKNLIWN
jgi:aryl-alcohol dehydrogenase-like predicted oxidoreductase